MIEEKENQKNEAGPEAQRKYANSHPLHDVSNNNQTIITEIVMMKENTKTDWSKLSHKRKWIYECEEKYEKELISILRKRPNASFFSERDPNVKNVVKFYVAFLNGIRCPTRKERDFLINYYPFKGKISLSTVHKSMPATSQISAIVHSEKEVSDCFVFKN